MAAALAIAANANNGSNITMIVGTYTNNGSEGIYSYKLNTSNGETSLLSSIATANPSFVTLSNDGSTIYTVNESNKDTDSAAAITYNKESGKMSLINRQLTNGKSPCYISTNGKIAVTANYGGGSLSVFPINPDKSLAPMSQQFRFPLTGPAPDTIRQQSAHVHCTVFSPDGSLLFATDLGNDKIYQFSIENDTLRKTTEYNLPAGSGPRHLTFSPNGDFAYLITELSGEVVAFSFDGSRLSHIQTIVCDKANGRIAIFKIDKNTGKLTENGYQSTGIHPRNFAITPDGKLLLCACRDNNEIIIHTIDGDGTLKDTGKRIDIPSPVCIIFKE